MKKKKGLNSNLSNRLSYTLIAVLILVAVGVGVYAATYSASGAGHPYTEISTCGINQILQMNSAGTAWTCANLPTLTKGTQIYQVNPYCPNAGNLQTSSSCSTIACSYGTFCCQFANNICYKYCAYYTFYTCSGSCSAGSSQSCSNTPVGSLVN